MGPSSKAACWHVLPAHRPPPPKQATEVRHIMLSSHLMGGNL